MSKAGPQWRGSMNTSWSGQRRSFPYQMRTKILARDPICVTCGINPSVIADHKTSHADCLRLGIEPDTLDNGQGMCQPCHDTKTKQEQRAGRARRSNKRPAPLHPGLVA